MKNFWETYSEKDLLERVLVTVLIALFILIILALPGVVHQVNAMIDSILRGT